MRDHSDKKIFFDTRIIRITEAILYCKRLYENLKIDPSTRIRVGIEHGDLKGRSLSAASRHSYFWEAPSKCDENEVITVSEFPLSRIDEDIVEIVQYYCKELFVLFGFQKFNEKVYSDIVNNFIQGKTH